MKYYVSWFEEMHNGNLIWQQRWVNTEEDAIRLVEEAKAKGHVSPSYRSQP